MLNLMLLQNRIGGLKGSGSSTAVHLYTQFCTYNNQVISESKSGHGSTGAGRWDAVKCCRMMKSGLQATKHKQYSTQHIDTQVQKPLEPYSQGSSWLVLII